MQVAGRLAICADLPQGFYQSGGVDAYSRLTAPDQFAEKLRRPLAPFFLRETTSAVA
jgi:hypothetical protein